MGEPTPPTRPSWREHMSITVTDLVIFLVGLLLGILIGAVFFGDEADAAVALIGWW
jgi:hypothetical protein